MMQAEEPICNVEFDGDAKTTDAPEFAELVTLARAGHLADIVRELLGCRKSGGPRVLPPALDSLDSLQADGPVTTVAIAGEVARALGSRDLQTATYAFELASLCAKRGEDQRNALIVASSIQRILSTMVYFKEDPHLQYLGMGTMSDIIWTNVEGLRDFIRCNGFVHAEDAMQRFPQDAKLQRRAIAQISSAAKWPENLDLMKASTFQPYRAIALTKQAMLLHPGDADLQLKGMEVMSVIVGTSFEDLFAFASGGGLDIYERAMLRFPEHAGIQEKVFKTFAGAIHWPENVCRRTGYDAERGLAFMKQAMSLHLENEKFQRLATEKLKKNFLPAHAEVIARCGGGDVVRAVMLQHPNAKDITDCCKSILVAIGEPVPVLSYRGDVPESVAASTSGMLELSFMFQT